MLLRNEIYQNPLCPQKVKDLVYAMTLCSELKYVESFYGDIYAYSEKVFVIVFEGTYNLPLLEIISGQGVHYFKNEVFLVEIVVGDGSYDVQISNEEGEPLGYVDLKKIG